MAELGSVAAALALVVGIVVGSACSSAPETGTVRGRLVMEGGFTDTIRPVAGVVAIARGDGKTMRVTARRVGGFTATVPVGTVRLTGAAPNFDGGDNPCAALHAVKVRSGAATTADVVCFVR
jgi:hypothetical protein